MTSAIDSSHATLAFSALLSADRRLVRAPHPLKASPDAFLIPHPPPSPNSTADARAATQPDPVAPSPRRPSLPAQGFDATPPSQGPAGYARQHPQGPKGSSPPAGARSPFDGAFAEPWDDAPRPSVSLAPSHGSAFGSVSAAAAVRIAAQAEAYGVALGAPAHRPGRVVTAQTAGLLALLRAANTTHSVRQRLRLFRRAVEKETAQAEAADRSPDRRAEQRDVRPLSPRSRLRHEQRRELLARLTELAARSPLGVPPAEALPEEVFDDVEGNFLPLMGESLMERYVVQSVLGRGTFGVCVACYDTQRSERVAIKLLRARKQYLEQGRVEVELLVKLAEYTRPNVLTQAAEPSPPATATMGTMGTMGSTGLSLPPLDPQRRPSAARRATVLMTAAATGGTNHLVKMRKHFAWQSHLCISFELLNSSLYDLLKRTQFTGLTVPMVAKFGVQLARAATLLADLPSPIVHCDIKPENILLVKPNRSHVKLIDFGASSFASAERKPRYVQSRFYRAPEVILRVPYGLPVDTWSAACVLFEMYAGRPLFDGQSEPDQLLKLQRVLGPLPPAFVRASPKRALFRLRPAVAARNGEGPTLPYFELTRTPSAPPPPSHSSDHSIAPRGSGQRTAATAADSAVSSARRESGSSSLRSGNPPSPGGAEADWDAVRVLPREEVAARLLRQLERVKAHSAASAGHRAPVPDAAAPQLADLLSGMLRYDVSERLAPVVWGQHPLLAAIA